LRGTIADQFLVLALELSLSVQVGGRVANRYLMVLELELSWLAEIGPHRAEIGSSTIAVEQFLVLARELSLSVQVGELFWRVLALSLWYCLLPGFTRTTGFMPMLPIPSTVTRLTR
jgi:hypothetical protein